MTSKAHTFPPALIIALSVVAGGLLYAGPLNPPAGPVTGTYKTLNEVEPRTAINAANTPGDADSIFRITAPGTYYVTGNITGITGKSAIEIASNNVTLDLMGFTLQGIVGTPSGVRADAAYNNVTVRNGILTGWGGDGVELATGSITLGHVVENITVRSVGSVGVRVRNGLVRGCCIFACAGGGILGLDASKVEDCRVTGGSGGIFCGVGGVVRSCIVEQSTGDGISVDAGGLISHCTSRANGAFGIGIGVGGRIIDCASRDNSDGGIFANAGGVIEGCSATNNHNDGISTFAGCLVANCTSSTNGLSGIRVTSNCNVRGNASTANGTVGVGAGIVATSSDNRIEGNNCADNDIGFSATSAGNFFTRNTASGNTTNNWDVVTGNVCLVFLATNSAAVTGNAGGSAPGSTDPNANFSY